ncbi:MAG: C45 family autoproteolytic acyltransferase/hydrolase [Thermoplasmata archaeon]
MKRDKFLFKELSGNPFQIGFEMGNTFSNEIRRTLDSFAFIFSHDYSKSWNWLIDFSNKNFLHTIDGAIREEIEGIVKGYNQSGLPEINFDDIFALNVLFDAESFLSAGTGNNQGSCTSFIATGDYTKTRDVILAHTTWWRYFTGINFNVIIKIKPDEGYSFVMQTAPGLLFSGTDFYYNEKGIVASETTLDGIHTYKLGGTPIFQRLRLAIQNSATIDDFSNFIINDNTGGYSNDYLIGDGKNKEIGILEIASFNHVLMKKNNGYFASSNLVQFDEIRKESNIVYDDSINSDNSRFYRIHELLNNGGLDVETSKGILADHYDYSLKKYNPGKNSICGHRDIEPNLDVFDKKPPFYPTGSIDAKIVSGNGALRGEGEFKWGKPCSEEFYKEDFLSHHPEYSWTGNFLEDVYSGNWQFISHGWK